MGICLTTTRPLEPVLPPAVGAANLAGTTHAAAAHLQTPATALASPAPPLLSPGRTLLFTGGSGREGPPIASPRLSNEARLLINGWNRISRGMAIGLFPTDYDRPVADLLRQTTGVLEESIPDHAYNHFSNLLTNFILDVADPEMKMSPEALRARSDEIISALDKIKTSLLFVNAACLLFEAYGKLGLDRSLVVNERRDLAAEALSRVSKITSDENTLTAASERMVRGHSDQLASYTQLFMALAHLGMKERVRGHIEVALELIDGISSPNARGRYGSSLFAVLKTLGYEEYIYAGGRDRVEELLDFIDDDGKYQPSPDHMGRMRTTFYYTKAYPFFMTLIAIGVLGRPEYLKYKQDRLAQAKEILASVSDEDADEIAKLTGLYLVALSNLGLLEQEIPDLGAYLEEFKARIMGLPADVVKGDPLYVGRSLGYMTETLFLFGRDDLITPDVLERWTGYLDVEHVQSMTRNEPYNAGFILTVFGELSRTDALPQIPRFVRAFSRHPQAAADFVPMLNHAVLNAALRMRGQGREPEIFSSTEMNLDRLAGAIRRGETIGRVSAHDLYEQRISQELGLEVGLCGDVDHPGIWTGREGLVAAMRSAATLLVHTHTPQACQYEPSLGKPSDGDINLIRRFGGGSRAVVSVDGVYLFNDRSTAQEVEWSADGTASRPRTVSGMVLVPTHNVYLINDAGQLLIEPVIGNSIPIRFINEPTETDTAQTQV